MSENEAKKETAKGAIIGALDYWIKWYEAIKSDVESADLNELDINLLRGAARELNDCVVMPKFAELIQELVERGAGAHMGKALEEMHGKADQ